MSLKGSSPETGSSNNNGSDLTNGSPQQHLVVLDGKGVSQQMTKSGKSLKQLIQSDSNTNTITSAKNSSTDNGVHHTKLPPHLNNSNSTVSFPNGHSISNSTDKTDLSYPPVPSKNTYNNKKNPPSDIHSNGVSGENGANHAYSHQSVLISNGGNSNTENGTFPPLPTANPTNNTNNSTTSNGETSPGYHGAATTTTPQLSPEHANVLTMNGRASPYSQARRPRSRQVSQSLELTIPLYYAGKHVFITGATGFIGKVLIEKLFRSCPQLGGVYCLIRPKNKQTVEQRMVELGESKLFDKLRQDQPDFSSKLHPVEGDVLQPNLGLSAENCAMLESKINVVFHSAATVRFDEPLRKAVEMNVVSVRKILALCRRLQHLEAIVHVSTAYANCDMSHIEEKVYPPPVDPQKIIDVLGWMTDEMVDLFTPKLLGEKPNTYTYTKQLAEHLLVTEGADLPLAIVRPSIVGAAWKEPFPGWIDNFNGPSGMYIAAGKGILRWMKADLNAVADIVPVDIPVNIMIAVGWYTAVAKPKSIHIYHATTGSANPFRWGEMTAMVNKSFKQIPLEKCFRRPNVAMTNNPFAQDYWKFVSHLFPAYVCDMAFTLVGRKPRMVKLYNRLHHSIDCLQFFTCNEWQWESSNVEMLKHQLTPDDFRTFYFDIRPLHWPTYIENYCLGAKKYVLNEDLSGLPAARAHIRKLKIIRTLFNSAICVVLWRVLIAKSNFARNLWFFIVKLVFKFVRFFRITSTMQKR